MSEPRAIDLVDNAADGEQVRRATRIEKTRVRRRGALLRQQLSTPDGREFVWSVLAAAGIHDDCHGDTTAVFRFLGRRELGLELLKEIQESYTREFLSMQSEAMARVKRDQEDNAAARTTAAAAD